MTQDQVYIPRTRSSLGLPPLEVTKEDIHGQHVADDVKQELYEALGDSPLYSLLGMIKYLVSRTTV